MKASLISVILLFLTMGVMAQEDQIALWRLTNLSGELKFEGLYREQEIIRPYLSDQLTSSQFLVGIRLNTHSYVYHPNLLQLDLGVEFTPEKDRDSYIIIPDRGEVRTTRKLDFRTYIFQGKFISFNTFNTYSRTFSRRENLTNLQTDAKTWGAGMTLRNSFLPLFVQYSQGSSEQVEVNTLRVFKYDHTELEARSNKSFGARDKHELVFSWNKYIREDRELPPLRTDISDLTLSSECFLDPLQKHRWYSRISATDNKGYDTYERLQAFESFSFKLPYNLTLLTSYAYHGINREVGSYVLQNARGTLNHQLFQSLRTGLFGDYSSAKQPGFKQNDPRAGIDLNYSKRIPKGDLSINYRYQFQHQDRSGETTNLNVFQQEYVLKDGKIVLLIHPYVDANTIVVTDETGSLIYQLNFDYLLIPRGNYLEIIRVAGGQITDGSSVYLSYTAVLPGSYRFDLHGQGWNVNLNLFDRLIGLYYRRLEQKYSNLYQTEYIALNYITEQIFGLRMEYKGISIGAEYDDNQSTILPYRMKRLYLNAQGGYRQRIIYTLNADLSAYHLIDENLDNTYANISGMLAFTLGSHSKLNFDASYRQQTGQGIDLELLNARIEYTYAIRQLRLSAGLESYRRDYLKEIDNYSGIFVRLSRSFSK